MRLLIGGDARIVRLLALSRCLGGGCGMNDYLGNYGHLKRLGNFLVQI